MPGKAIGTNLEIGYPGTPSRMQDCVIAPYKYASANTGNIGFGEPVVYDSTYSGVRKIKREDSTTDIIGIAVRRMGQPHSDSADGWYYAPGEVVDVMLRGSIVVPLKSTTSIAALGTVYVCNGTGTNDAGDIVCASGADTVVVQNALFSTGVTNATEKVAEVTITKRSI